MIAKPQARDMSMNCQKGIEMVAFAG